MECEILKKQLRTSRRSRCPVRADKADAAQILSSLDEPDVEGLRKRLLCLARETLIQTRPGGNETESTVPGNWAVISSWLNSFPDILAFTKSHYLLDHFSGGRSLKILFRSGY
jgi:hypothetical protein